MSSTTRQGFIVANANGPRRRVLRDERRQIRPSRADVIEVGHNGANASVGFDVRDNFFIHSINKPG